MSSSTQPLTNIKTRRHFKRAITEALIKARPFPTNPPQRRSVPSKSTVRIVCISDTHNKRPVIPAGDVLIHAGDLTENGSFDEVQGGLDWLSSQPHKYKIFVAGNHDVLLDDASLEEYPERRYGETRTREDLDWGSVIHLQDEMTTVEFSENERNNETQMGILEGNPAQTRTLTIFGSPWTPKYGISAFQYRPNDADHWSNIFAWVTKKPDIVITHGPPHLHLDKRDFHRAGCPYLSEELYRLKPRLSVFGHIHASYGREDVRMDRIQRIHEEVLTGWDSWLDVAWMAILIVWVRITRLLGRIDEDNMVIFVNAASVGGPDNELRNEPIVVEL